jgi:cytochrome c biogenesis protein CcmG, thiol:disulfide interchange protein DsbE
VSSKSFAVVLAVLAVIGLLGFGLLSKGEASISLGDTAPDKRLQALDGSGSGQIADYRGKWVFVNFWASWCEPCKAEAPLLEKAWRTYRDRGLVVLGVNSQDLSSDARRFAKQVGWTYPLVRDGAGDILGPYAVAAFPETFFVDRKGKLVARIDGEVSEDELETNIERALA